jgi:hypothetical protein
LIASSQKVDNLRQRGTSMRHGRIIEFKPDCVPRTSPSTGGYPIRACIRGQVARADARARTRERGAGILESDTAPCINEAIAKDAIAATLQTEPGKSRHVRQEVKFGLCTARLRLHEFDAATGRRRAAECKLGKSML